MSYDTEYINIVIQFMMEKLETQGKKLNAIIRKQAKEIKNLQGGGNKGIRGLNSSLKKFRMEMFAVVYGGQLLTSMFESMLKPGEDALGMSERWSSTMLVTMLPALTQLYPAFDKLNNAIMDLPEPAQETIGWVAIIGDGALTAATNIAILALAFSSLTGKNAVDELKKVGTAIKDFGVGRTISLVLTIYFAYKFAKDVATMMTDVETSLTERLKSVFDGIFLGASVGYMFGGVPGALLGATIGFGIALVFNIMDIAWEDGWMEHITKFFSDSWEWMKAAWNNVMHGRSLGDRGYVDTLGFTSTGAWKGSTAFGKAADPNYGSFSQDTVAGRQTSGSLVPNIYVTINGNGDSTIKRIAKEGILEGLMEYNLMEIIVLVVNIIYRFG